MITLDMESNIPLSNFVFVCLGELAVVVARVPQSDPKDGEATP